MLMLRRKNGKEVELGPTFGCWKVFAELSVLVGDEAADKEYFDLLVIPQLGEEPVYEKQFKRMQEQAKSILTQYKLSKQAVHMLKLIIAGKQTYKPTGVKPISVRELKRRAKGKGLVVHKSRIDGTFMIEFRAS